MDKHKSKFESLIANANKDIERPIFGEFTPFKTNFEDGKLDVFKAEQNAKLSIVDNGIDGKSFKIDPSGADETKPIIKIDWQIGAWRYYNIFFQLKNEDGLSQEGLYKIKLLDATGKEYFTMDVTADFDGVDPGFQFKVPQVLENNDSLYFAVYASENAKPIIIDDFEITEVAEN